LVRRVDAVRPTPPKVDIRTKPSEEQLAHMLESTLRDDPENNDELLTFSLLECLSTYTFMPTTMLISIAVILETMKSTTPSLGK